MGAFSDAGQSSSGGGGGGILGSVVDAGKKVGGVAINALSAPEQVLLGAAGGLASLNDPRTALSDFGHAGIKALTLGQGGGPNWDFAQAAGKQTSQGRTAVKLPTGVNTALTMGLDPLNFVGAGAGGEAKAGMSAIARGLGGIDENLVRQSARAVGGKALVENIGRDAIKSSIAKDILENSGKAENIGAKFGQAEAENFANTQAEKMLNAVEKRGGGGIFLHAPGTDATANILKGSTIDALKDSITGSKAGQLVTEGARAAKLPEAAAAVRRGLEPGYHMAQEVGKTLSKDVRVLSSGKIAQREAMMDNLKAELSNSVKAAEQRAGRAITPEDDRLVQFALQGGPDARTQVLAEHPHLEPMVTAGDRIRTAITQGKVDAGLLNQAMIHDPEGYLRRVMTPEMLEVSKANPNLMNDLASRTGGSTSSSLYLRSNKARKLAPDMPDTLFNQLVSRVQNGEDARAILDEPAFDKYIGAAQKQKAADLLEQQKASILSQPVTPISPEDLRAQAQQHYAEADAKIQAAIDAQEPTVTIGSNVYHTPETPEQMAALKNVLNSLGLSTQLEGHYSGPDYVTLD